MAEPEFWTKLFAPASAGTVRSEFREWWKQGRPFLLFPKERRLAAATLALYAPQSSRARLARSALRFLLSLGVPLGTKPVTLSISTNDPFLEFLANSAGCAGAIARFGVLAGNPAGGTQRFVVLTFGSDGNPKAVVKTGVTPLARDLVRKEAAFLAAVPKKLLGMPKLLGNFEDAERAAFATAFVPGDSPESEAGSSIAKVLNSWVDETTKVRIGDSTVWQQLRAAAGAHQLFPTLRNELEERHVQATIQHGDFAPWNIKVQPSGDWVVLDWERGELKGIPGWDWFHYFVQTSILVGRVGVTEIVTRLEALLQSELFRNYASRSGIAGFKRSLIKAYLLYVCEVIRPAEGLSQTRAVLEALS